jgi:hypothetical protein
MLSTHKAPKLQGRLIRPPSRGRGLSKSVENASSWIWIQIIYGEFCAQIELFKTFICVETLTKSSYYDKLSVDVDPLFILASIYINVHLWCVHSLLYYVLLAGAYHEGILCTCIVHTMMYLFFFIDIGLVFC